MAMKKAELEEQRENYTNAIGRARNALADGEHQTAVQIAVSACEFVDGMMRFEQRFEGVEVNTVEAFEIVSMYAPLLFDSQSIQSLEALLKKTRRIEKNTLVDLAEMLANAKDRMRKAHRLWSSMQRNAGGRVDEIVAGLDGPEREWSALLDSWELMGVIRRTQEGATCRLSLATRPEERMRAKCPACGRVILAPKAKLWAELACPACQAHVLFVLLPEEIAAHSKG